jgi:hypothetical protein
MDTDRTAPDDPLEAALVDAFRAGHIDFVPDPMVLRAAELVLLGSSGVSEAYIGGEPGDLWPVIERNLDGVLAFFHLVMTRERIPLIDYGFTFPGTALPDLLGDLAVFVHPPYPLYQRLLADARTRVADLGVGALEPALLRRIRDDLGATGYEWFPDEARYLDRPEDERVAATFVTGGVIFGAYADLTGSEHVLQRTRATAFAELTTAEAGAAVRDPFRRLAEDPAVAVADRALPPSVVPVLLADRRIDSTAAMLRAALDLRSSDLGRAYREWPAADAPYGTATTVDIAGTASGRRRVHAWIVEHGAARRHRKLLLRTERTHLSGDELRRRLGELWHAS